MSKETPPIIIVRRPAKRGKARQGGSWKIAYADFMTAMMAFFLVMWILSLIPREELKGIADYFRMPLVEAISARHSASLIPSDNGADASVIPDLAPAPPALFDEDAEINWLDVQRLEGLMLLTSPCM